MAATMKMSGLQTAAPMQRRTVAVAPSAKSIRAPLCRSALSNAHPQALKPSCGPWVLRRQAPVTRPMPAPQAAAAQAGEKQPEKEKSPGFLGIAPLTWAKVLPLGGMFFCILFNYTVLRSSKDVLIVTAPGSGAEVIPLLKVLNTPMAVGFTVIYSTLAAKLSREQLFYAVLIPFLVFFGAFAAVVYPNKEALQPNGFCDMLLKTFGEGFSGPIALIRNWSYVCFFMMAEIWGSVVISLLFWGTANQVMTVQEAKQFYPLFGMGANLSLVVAGRAIQYFSNLKDKVPAGVDSWGVALKGMMGMVVFSGLCICGFYYILTGIVVPKMQAAQIAAGVPPKKKNKTKMSSGDSIKFLTSSPYIRDMATMVIAFGVCINLVEVTWKAKLKDQFPNPADYSAFMGVFSEYTGVVTLGMMMVGRFVLGKFGWGVAALATPTVLLITALMFFGLVLAGDVVKAPLAAFGLTPLYAAVVVGAAQNVFSRSSKYSLFDPCKEMAYIPMDSSEQAQCKAAIDVMGNLIGKSGGAVVQQGLIVACGSLANSTPALGVLLTSIILFWMKACVSLNTQFQAKYAEYQASGREGAVKKAAPAPAPETPAPGVSASGTSTMNGNGEGKPGEGSYMANNIVPAPATQSAPAPSN